MTTTQTLPSLGASALVSMTSREIAELTGKEHRHVLRDIDNLLKTLSPDLGSGFSIAYEGDPAHGYRYFILDRDSTYCLVAGYDANARMRIIKRWQELETGGPRSAVIPGTAPRPRHIREAFSCCMSIAKMIGLTGNPAALAADIGTRNLTGVSVLALMDQTHLVADPRGRTYTATEIGKMLEPPLSAVKTNRLIETKGLQVHDIKGDWVPTEQARHLCEWLDTNKRHSDGTPVKQLKWFSSVVAVLSQEDAA